LYFFKFAEFLPSFCGSFAEFDETLFSGPQRVVRRDEFYNTDPHAIPGKTIEKLPSFQGNNDVNAKVHVKSFMRCIN
jgi:hypothetical protein